MWPILINSKGRPGAKLFRALSAAGLPFTAFVEPQEAKDYRLAVRPLGGKVRVIPLDDCGLCYTLGCALIYARERRLGWYWLLDDDIAGFYRVAGGKCVLCSPNEALAGAQAVITRFPGAAHGALEYQQFAWSAKTDAASGYCDVAVAIHSERSKPAFYQTGLELKVDRDFTLQILANGRDVVRCRSYAFAAPQNGTNPGGLSAAYARAGAEAAESRRMALKWPGVCTPVTKARGRADVRVDWKRLRPRLVRT